jgi:hypothetical protein
LNEILPTKRRGSKILKKSSWMREIAMNMLC